MSEEPAQRKRAISVSRLLSQASNTLEDMGSFWVAGEVFEYRGAHASGHRYFKLRDEDSSISVILWRGHAARALHCELEEGRRVLAHGHFDIYPQRGTLSFLLDHVEDLGGGDLAARFERNKKRLREEGLFDQERKRALPELPQRLVVICAGASAAEADILRALHSAPAPMEILLLPTRVQGAGAAEALASALGVAASVSPDVILLSRGGGSLEDLWAFNEEVLVRAVVASSVPVVSAVGHESDITLCDLAADHRAMTPTDGAVTLLSGWYQLQQSLYQLGEQLMRAGRDFVQTPQRPLARLRQRFREQSPERRLARLRHRLAEAENRHWHAGREPLRRARQSLERRLSELRQHAPDKAVMGLRARLDKAKLRLEVGDPQALLARGYALVELRPKAGKESKSKVSYLRDPAAAASGSPLRIRLAKGDLDATVD